jgi:periplasmic divalent cation tolerance protein
MAEIELIYVTVSSGEEAEKIAKAVVSERLAACANILGSIQSVYHWQGKLEQATEVALLLKTQGSVVDSLVARIRQLHSYECPAIVAIPVLGGSPEFLAWVASETSVPDKGC